MSSSIDRLKQKFYDLDALESAMSLMGWDQQTFMPEGGNGDRAEHLGALSRLHHEMLTSDETGKLIDEAGRDASTDVEKALVRVTKREFDQSTKLPAKLVEERSILSAKAHEEWVRARKENDFKSFAPTLERMFEIARESAEHLGYTNHIYDALVDLYEEGATHEQCKQMFESLKAPSIELIRRTKEEGTPTDNSFLTGGYSVEAQKALTEKLVQKLGFDFHRGRQDTAPHPFCGGTSRNDIRLTTRFLDDVKSAIFASAHEAGHGMYEQGSPQEFTRTPIAGGVSLGIHESQSLLWENLVARSKPFWDIHIDDFNAAFPHAGNVSAETFYKAINQVQPSLIRVEADEVTYNMHVLTRFEIESDILEGKLAVRDLPDAWNAKYEEYLGITPPSDTNGCLQDVHWSGGMVGYFPTYTMGKLLSYQIWEAMSSEIGDPYQYVAEGDFETIRSWLEEKIYSQGKLYPPKELVMRVTGKPMSHEDFIKGVTKKCEAVYGLASAQPA